MTADKLRCAVECRQLSTFNRNKYLKLSPMCADHSNKGIFFSRVLFLCCFFFSMLMPCCFPPFLVFETIADVDLTHEEESPLPLSVSSSDESPRHRSGGELSTFCRSLAYTVFTASWGCHKYIIRMASVIRFAEATECPTFPYSMPSLVGSTYSFTGCVYQGQGGPLAPHKVEIPKPLLGVFFNVQYTSCTFNDVYVSVESLLTATVSMTITSSVFTNGFVVLPGVFIVGSGLTISGCTFVSRAPYTLSAQQQIITFIYVGAAIAPEITLRNNQISLYHDDEATALLANANNPSPIISAMWWEKPSSMVLDFSSNVIDIRHVDGRVNGTAMITIPKSVSLGTDSLSIINNTFTASRIGKGLAASPLLHRPRRFPPAVSMIRGTVLESSPATVSLGTSGKLLIENNNVLCIRGGVMAHVESITGTIWSPGPTFTFTGNTIVAERQEIMPHLHIFSFTKPLELTGPFVFSSNVLLGFRGPMMGTTVQFKGGSASFTACNNWHDGVHYNSIANGNAYRLFGAVAAQTDISFASCTALGSVPLRPETFFTNPTQLQCAWHPTLTHEFTETLTKTDSHSPSVTISSSVSISESEDESSTLSFETASMLTNATKSLARTASYSAASHSMSASDSVSSTVNNSVSIKESVSVSHSISSTVNNSISVGDSMSVSESVSVSDSVSASHSVSGSLGTGSVSFVTTSPHPEMSNSSGVTNSSASTPTLAFEMNETAIDNDSSTNVEDDSTNAPEDDGTAAAEATTAEEEHLETTVEDDPMTTAGDDSIEHSTVTFEGDEPNTSDVEDDSSAGSTTSAEDEATSDAFETFAELTTDFADGTESAVSGDEGISITQSCSLTHLPPPSTSSAVDGFIGGESPQDPSDGGDVPYYTRPPVPQQPDVVGVTAGTGVIAVGSGPLSGIESIMSIQILSIFATMSCKVPGVGGEGMGYLLTPLNLDTGRYGKLLGQLIIIAGIGLLYAIAVCVLQVVKQSREKALDTLKHPRLLPMAHQMVVSGFAYECCMLLYGNEAPAFHERIVGGAGLVLALLSVLAYPLLTRLGFTRWRGGNGSEFRAGSRRGANGVPADDGTVINVDNNDACLAGNERYAEDVAVEIGARDGGEKAVISNEMKEKEGSSSNIKKWLLKAFCGCEMEDSFEAYTEEERSRVWPVFRHAFAPKTYWLKPVQRTARCVHGSMRPDRARTGVGNQLYRALLICIVCAIPARSEAWCTGILSTAAIICILHGLFVLTVMCYRVPLENICQALQSFCVGAVAITNASGGDDTAATVLAFAMMGGSLVSAITGLGAFIVEWRVLSPAVAERHAKKEEEGIPSEATEMAEVAKKGGDKKESVAEALRRASKRDEAEMTLIGALAETALTLLVGGDGVSTNIGEHSTRSRQQQQQQSRRDQYAAASDVVCGGTTEFAAIDMPTFQNLDDAAGGGGKAPAASKKISKEWQQTVEDPMEWTISGSFLNDASNIAPAAQQSTNRSNNEGEEGEGINRADLSAAPEGGQSMHPAKLFAYHHYKTRMMGDDDERQQSASFLTTPTTTSTPAADTSAHALMPTVISVPRTPVRKGIADGPLCAAQQQALAALPSGSSSVVCGGAGATPPASYERRHIHGDVLPYTTTQLNYSSNNSMTTGNECSTATTLSRAATHKHRRRRNFPPGMVDSGMLSTDRFGVSGNHRDVHEAVGNSHHQQPAAATPLAFTDNSSGNGIVLTENRNKDPNVGDQLDAIKNSHDVRTASPDAQPLEIVPVVGAIGEDLHHFNDLFSLDQNCKLSSSPVKGCGNGCSPVEHNRVAGELEENEVGAPPSQFCVRKSRIGGAELSDAFTSDDDDDDGEREGDGEKASAKNHGGEGLEGEGTNKSATMEFSPNRPSGSQHSYPTMALREQQVVGMMTTEANSGTTSPTTHRQQRPWLPANSCTRSANDHNTAATATSTTMIGRSLLLAESKSSDTNNNINIGNNNAHGASDLLAAEATTGNNNLPTAGAAVVATSAGTAATRFGRRGLVGLVNTSSSPNFGVTSSNSNNNEQPKPAHTRRRTEGSHPFRRAQSHSSHSPPQQQRRDEYGSSSTAKPFASASFTHHNTTRNNLQSARPFGLLLQSVGGSGEDFEENESPRTALQTESSQEVSATRGGGGGGGGGEGVGEDSIASS